MKRHLIIAVCSLSLLSVGCGSGEQAGQAADFAAYIAVQEALARDDLDGARQALQALQEHSSGPVKKLASQAATAQGIAAIRSAFIPISEKMAQREIPEGHGLVFCPMANDDRGGHWVQKEGTVMNPYFGSAMLHCGIFKGGEKNKLRL